MEGLDRVPDRGPMIVAANHLSYLDPLVHGYFIDRAGRRPRFLAKQELFENVFLRTILQGGGQIPVRRGIGDRTALDEATRALEHGEVVVVYPEGTSVTDRPDFSPARGKTGVARLSLSTDVPILPVATWGGQYVWRKGERMRLQFGRPLWLKAGDQLTADPADSGPDEARRLTDRTMDAVTVLVSDLRRRYPKRWS
jgi:1-acyl-sn-glycerol-3-phosphate acyltransferase